MISVSSLGDGEGEELDFVSQPSLLCRAAFHSQLIGIRRPQIGACPPPREDNPGFYYNPP